MKTIYNVVDRSMGGPGSYTVAGQIPDLVEWNWEYDPTYETFFVNWDVLHPVTDRIKGYALLFESKSLMPMVYDQIEKNLDRFKLVFTPDSHLVEKYPHKCKWIPAGGIWVGGSYGEGEIKIHEKSKMISQVSSTKESCPLHSYRYNLAKYLKDTSKVVDVTIGENCDPNLGWKPICHSLHDYRFSIVVENIIDKWNFCESLSNCFATGTIPIYYGATELDKYFNMDGVILINEMSKDEVLDLTNSLTVNDYIDKMDAIKENFEIVKQFRTLEDYVQSNYLARMVSV